MDKTEKLAAHLLNIYWTGAGDAGDDSVIFQHHTDMSDPKNLEQALENGKSTKIMYLGKMITQTEYFKMLAEKILADL